MRHNFWITCQTLLAILAVLRPYAVHAQAEQHAGMHHEHHMMPAALGNYPHTREASGTAWQPDSTPMEGWHFSASEWSVMAHATVYGVYDHQGGKRGDEKLFSNSMGMLMASRPLGGGTLGVRSMLSLDPLMGKNGYPLLLQTGETADGEAELVDRQHPHDLFMELAASYSYPITADASMFVYAGLPGEPALGPPSFMHRYSGFEAPEAPIAHHWLDSSHVTEGVTTLGFAYSDFKLETSAFNGREPDQYRYNIETRALDSHSFRLTWNPAPNWSGQVSYGKIQSPEQLSPDVDQERVTSSLSYNRPFVGGNWATTVAWGRNLNTSGNTLDAFLLESLVQAGERHTIFSRYENVEKDELFGDETELSGRVLRVSKISLGYIYDLRQFFPHTKIGIGAEGNFSFLPESAESGYGESPFSSLVFVRARLQ